MSHFLLALATFFLTSLLSTSADHDICQSVCTGNQVYFIGVYEEGTQYSCVDGLRVEDHTDSPDCSGAILYTNTTDEACQDCSTTAIVTVRGFTANLTEGGCSGTPFVVNTNVVVELPAADECDYYGWAYECVDGSIIRKKYDSNSCDGEVLKQQTLTTGTCYEADSIFGDFFTDSMVFDSICCGDVHECDLQVAVASSAVSVQGSVIMSIISIYTLFLM